MFAAIAALLPVALTALLEAPAQYSEARPLELAASYSCTPKRACTKVASCEEARWLLANCSWGGKLDRDNDGVPCEDLCPGG